MLIRLLLLGLVLLGCVIPGRAGEQPVSLRITPPFPWARDLGAPPRIPLVGDVNGDGFDDLLSLWPTGKCWLDVAINGKGQKSLPPRRVLNEFGENCIAATTARLNGELHVIALFQDGAVRVASALSGEAKQQVWGKVLRKKLPNEAWLAAVSGEGARAHELLVAYPDGGVEQISWDLPRSPLSDQVLSGSIGVPLRGVLVNSYRLRPLEPTYFAIHFPDGRGNLRTQTLAWSGLPRPDATTNKADLPALLGRRRRVWREQLGAFAVHPDDGQLLPRLMLSQGQPTPFRPDLELAKRYDVRNLGWDKPSMLRTGDINGDRQVDLIRFRQDDEKHSGSDVLVYLAYHAGDRDPDADGLTSDEEAALGSDPLLRDTDNDGLLDGWEVKGYGGSDLKALGCSPNHADVLVRIQRVSDTDEAKVRADMERAGGYYARLPVANRDGTQGIALHFVLEQPLPKDQAARSWWQLGSRYFSEDLRGVWHWMLVPNAGGGQSDMLADRGSSGGRALYATFIHEFGHQLGLSHEGFWTGGWCPAYPSLMNYAYSYQLGGKADAIGYSTGKLAGITFDERSLSERLPLKHEEVAFLAGPPYRWRLKPDGEQTLVDWNWNGVFGEEQVRADINYGYSTTAGRRQIMMPGRNFDAQDRTGHAPFLVIHGKKLYLFYVAAPADAKPDERMTPEERAAAKSIPGPVQVRMLLGGNRWSDPVPVSPEIATGDPFAVSHGGKLWLFFPSETGLKAQALSPKGTAAGKPLLLPGTTGVAVSAVSWNRRLLLFLWRGADRDVTWTEWDGKSTSSEQSLGFRSTIPVGLCVDPLTQELILGCAQDQDERRPSRWLTRRFTWSPQARSKQQSLTSGSIRWVMGEAGTARGTRRPTLLFESGPGAGKAGRLHFLAVGTVAGSTRKACYYDCMTIEDRTINDGWLQRRYYDEWTESASAHTACWYQGDIALASRWYGAANREFRDNGVYVALQGLGIQSEPMGDHNDVALISGRGLTHSILYLSARTDLSRLRAVSAP